VPVRGSPSVLTGQHEQLIEDLRVRWERTLALHRAADPGAVAFQKLIACYGEPDRHYHTLQHVADVLAAVETLREQAFARAGIARNPVQLPAVTLAVFYHDAVYMTAGAGSERFSAKLAVKDLVALGLSDQICGEVSRLIELTEKHNPAEDDPSGQLLVDADLMILASPADRYRRYVHQIRAEYSWVSEEQWREGR
jgi:predicted metal-dependent HD superfamily phosphohydrolase